MSSIRAACIPQRTKVQHTNNTFSHRNLFHIYHNIYLVYFRYKWLVLVVNFPRVCFTNHRSYIVVWGKAVPSPYAGAYTIFIMFTLVITKIWYHPTLLINLFYRQKSYILKITFSVSSSTDVMTTTEWQNRVTDIPANSFFWRWQINKIWDQKR